eukprot:6737123-Pyramimonas_sp.AAC.1
MSKKSMLDPNATELSVGHKGANPLVLRFGPPRHVGSSRQAAATSVRVFEMSADIVYIFEYVHAVGAL